jgi:hypothetical protein
MCPQSKRLWTLFIGECAMSKYKYPYARLSPVTVMEDFPIGTVIYTTTYRDLSTDTHKVEGYIFDGSFWYPAYDTWDGWYPYLGDEDESDNMYQPITNEDSKAIEDWLGMINDINDENK